MKNKDIKLAKLLLLLFVCLYLYPYAKAFIEIYFLKKEVYLHLMNPIKLIFDLNIWKQAPESTFLETYNFKVINHPFQYMQSLLEWFELILLISGTYCIFKNGFKKSGIILVLAFLKFWHTLSNIVSIFIKRYLWDYIGDANMASSKTYYGEFILMTCISLSICILLIRTLLRLRKAESPLLFEYQENSTKWMRSVAFFTERLFIFLPIFMSFIFFSRYISYYKFGIDHFQETVPENALIESFLKSLFILAFCIIVFLVYFLSEWLFGITLFKVISGTEVRSSKTGERPSALQILLKSIGRFIPLNLISFLFVKGWQDSISSTEIRYTANENWLLRHTRIAKVFLGVSLLLLIWNVLHGLTVFIDDNSDNFHFQDLEITVIASLSFWLILSLFISAWLATVSDYTQNYGNKYWNDDGGSFFKSLLIWVPLLNFFMLNELLQRIRFGFEVLDPEHALMKELKLRSRVFIVLFFIFYYLFIWFYLSLFSGGNSVFIFSSSVLAFGYTLCVLPLMAYVTTIKKISALLESKSISTVIVADTEIQ